MAGVFVLFFCTFILSHGVKSGLVCPPNEVSYRCSNSLCKVDECIQKRLNQCSYVKHCTRKCFCRHGYLRAPNGTCIPEDLCPIITCPPNEVVNECANAYCKVEECSQREGPVPCASVKYCEPGCNCRGEYLRADNGTCIPAELCPPLEIRRLDLQQQAYLRNDLPRIIESYYGLPEDKFMITQKWFQENETDTW